MIDPKTKKTEVRYVDIESDSYNVARNYMVRLEKEDLEDPQILEAMAKSAMMTKDEFVERFGYMVK
jgi:hypothetical protein